MKEELKQKAIDLLLGKIRDTLENNFSPETLIKSMMGLKQQTNYKVPLGTISSGVSDIIGINQMRYTTINATVGNISDLPDETILDILQYIADYNPTAEDVQDSSHWL